MSTRSIIARAKGDGWEGRYHHSDGYPSGMGAALYDHYHRSFNRDLTRMLEVLIDEHPGGWSFIHEADFSIPPGFVEYPRKVWDWENGGHRVNFQAQCYCHGDRSESRDLRTHDQPPGHREEYLYVMSPRKAQGIGRNLLLVFDTHYDHDILIGEVDLDDEEPDWGTMEVPEDSDHPAVIAYRAKMAERYPYIYG